MVDQILPMPSTLDATDLDNSNWIPTFDSLNTELKGNLADIRKFSDFRAYHDAEPFDFTKSKASRLIGRSVWNSKWLLVIPERSLLGSPDEPPSEGITRFIEGMPLGDGRDGNGVTDIKIFFNTYSYSRN